MIGWTLGRYLSARFLQTIAADFLMNSAFAAEGKALPELQFSLPKLENRWKTK